MSFIQLKDQIRSEYASLKTLPFHKRILAKLFGHRSFNTVSAESETAQYSQTFVVLHYNGTSYLERFGWK